MRRPKTTGLQSAQGYAAKRGGPYKSRRRSEVSFGINGRLRKSLAPPPASSRSQPTCDPWALSSFAVAYRSDRPPSCTGLEVSAGGYPAPAFESVGKVRDKNCERNCQAARSTPAIVVGPVGSGAGRWVFRAD